MSRDIALVRAALEAAASYVYEIDEEVCLASLSSAIAELDPAAIAATVPVEVCNWCENEDGTWDSDCDRIWQFTDGGVDENGVKFCHECGRSVIGHIYVEDEDDPRP